MTGCLLLLFGVDFGWFPVNSVALVVLFYLILVGFG